MITPLPDLFFSSLVMLPDSKTKTKRLVEHTFSQIKNLKSVPLISLFLISGITYPCSGWLKLLFMGVLAGCDGFAKESEQYKHVL